MVTPEKKAPMAIHGVTWAAPSTSAAPTITWASGPATRATPTAAGRVSSTMKDDCSRAVSARAVRPPRSSAWTMAGPPAMPSQMNITSRVRFARL